MEDRRDDPSVFFVVPKHDRSDVHRKNSQTLSNLPISFMLELLAINVLFKIWLKL